MKKPLLTLAIVATTLPHLASAALTDDYQFQASTRHVSAGARLWNRFFATLSAHPEEAADVTVKVLDAEGQPLTGATVLVGTKSGVPFAGNQQTSDANGIVRFSDASLRGGALPAVTAKKDGYSTLTLAAPAGNEIELRLPRQAADADVAFLEGQVSGYPTGYPSSTLEVGFFLPAIRPDALLNFDPQQFVSSYTTKINVFGERDVPGNVLLPTQRKRYGFIPISLSKPGYVMPLPTGFRAHLGALTGGVPISDALSAIQSNDFLGAINLASFARVTWTPNPVEVRAADKIDLTFDEEIAPKAVKASLRNVPPALDAVSVSLVDPSGQKDDFLPVDVKAIKSEAIRGGNASVDLGALKARRAGDGYYVFTGLFDRNQLTDKNAVARWIVGSLQPVDASGAAASFGAFLKPVAATGVSDSHRDFRFTSPANVEAGLAPDLVLLNLVSEKNNEQTHGVTRRTLWSAVLPGTADRVSLPDLGAPVLPAPDQTRGETFRWEVIAVKASSAAGSDIQSVLRNLQHVSTLSQKF